MSFAENLQAIQAAAKMSNYKMAKFIGCSQTSVANWLSGERLPHKKARFVIADAFGFTLEEIDGTLPKNYKSIVLDKIKTPTSEGERIPYKDKRELLAGRGVSILLDADAKLTEDQLDDIVNFIQFQQEKNGR